MIPSANANNANLNLSHWMTPEASYNLPRADREQVIGCNEIMDSIIIIAGNDNMRQLSEYPDNSSNAINHGIAPSINWIGVEAKSYVPKSVCFTSMSMDQEYIFTIIRHCIGT